MNDDPYWQPSRYSLVLKSTKSQRRSQNWSRRYIKFTRKRRRRLLQTNDRFKKEPPNNLPFSRKSPPTTYRFKKEIPNNSPFQDKDPQPLTFSEVRSLKHFSFGHIHRRFGPRREQPSKRAQGSPVRLRAHMPPRRSVLESRGPCRWRSTASPYRGP